MGTVFGRSEEQIRESLRDRPLVVICGGGFCGAALAGHLDQEFNVILIDRKNYFFHNLGALRASNQPDFVKNIAIPYTKIVKFGSVVQAEIGKITPDGVFVHGREEPIPFDYCVISTGSSYSFPCKVGLPMASSLPPLYNEVHETIRDAQKPVIIGGGAVGLELLGDIGSFFPEKEVVLVHSKEHVMTDEFPEYFRVDIEQRIATTYPQMRLILGTRAVLTGELSEASTKRFVTGSRTLELSNGETVETDLVFFCGGARINSKSYEETFADVLNERKQIRVNEFLQVEGQEKIFAVGDCSARNRNYGWIAKEHAKRTAANIIALDKGQAMTVVAEAMPQVIFLPLGTKDGTGLTPIGRIPTRIVQYMKGTDCAASMQWSELGFKGMPSEMMDMNASPDDDSKEDDEVAQATAEKAQRMADLTHMNADELQELFNGLPVPEADENATYT